MKRVLITGAKGFIGSHIMKFYCEKGFKVTGWDLYDDNICKVKSINLFDMDRLIIELKTEKPDIIIHCAGCADVSKSVQNPSADFEGNVKMVHNMLFGLKQCQMLNVKFLFLSSAAVYGNPDMLPVSENSDKKPMSPYALHKIMAEDICRYFGLNYNMDIDIVRIFSAYGNGLRKQIFWDMAEKLKKTGMLNMFGTGYESRDYIHINDIVRAIDLIINKAATGIQVYNIANGEEIMIREIAEKFAAAMGVGKEKIVFDNMVREGQPLNWRADIEKIKALGYKKSISIDEGIKLYADWIQSEKTI